EATDAESGSQEAEDEEVSGEETTTTSTTSTTTEQSAEDEEVIDGNDESQEETITSEPEGETESESSEDEDNSRLTGIGPDTAANNVTVSPELVAAMIKALQEALGVTAPPGVPTTTPLPVLSTL